MGKVFSALDDDLRAWLNKQHMFFVSTAPLSSEGLVNCSPKGYDCFRIFDARTVAYLDLTGSGVETIAHLKENARIVLMFCSFDSSPRIVRLHGKGEVLEKGTPEFNLLLPRFEVEPGMRSIIQVRLTRISDSCGYGVPRFEYIGNRNTLVEYWGNKSEAANADYKRTHNSAGVDGLPGLVRSE